jgi:hypothetical protein
MELNQQQSALCLAFDAMELVEQWQHCNARVFTSENEKKRGERPCSTSTGAFMYGLSIWLTGCM